MRAVAILICIILLFFGLVILFRSCTGFVSYFDGERQSKMVPIIGDYYFNRLDSSIWKEEKKTESYKRVTDNKIDSLAWGKEKSFGYSSNAYFSITLSTGEFVRLNNLDNIPFRQGKDEKFKKLDDIPTPAKAIAN